MSRRQRKDLLVFDMPEEIRIALVADAYGRNISVNDAAVEILAARFKVKFIPSGAPYTSEGQVVGRNLSIRGGAKLHRKIDMERARRGGGTLRGVVLETLALHYGLEPPPIGRRPRTKGRNEHSSDPVPS